MFKYIGFIAAFLTTASFLPQALKSIKTKDTRGVSLLMYSMFCSGVFLWAMYGFYINDMSIILANTITFIFSLIILVIKIRNVASDKET